MKADPVELQGTAKKFKKAGKDMRKIIADLEKSMKNLQKNWKDAGQQRFYESYQEWDEKMSRIVNGLDLISEELTAIARRYLDADK